MLGNSVADTLNWAVSLASESEKSTSAKLQNEGLGISRNRISSLANRPQMTSYSATESLCEDEREFLASILPMRVAAVSSDTYGSFSDFADTAVASESSHNSSGQDMSLQNTGSDSWIGIRSAWSTDSSCVDASGALNYYLACTRNPETKRLKESSPRKGPGSHHRRALNGNGTGPMEARAVPFSLAVEEIGSTAQVVV